MKLVHNWRDVLRHAWSVRLILLAGLLTGLEAAMPLMYDVVPVEQSTIAVITLAVVMAAFVARFIAQNSVSGDKQ